MVSTFHDAPSKPYCAVIFLAKLSEFDLPSYREIGEVLLDQARKQPGFQGYDDVGGESRFSFNVSYWEDLESIRMWRNDANHVIAQKNGESKWFLWYEAKIARVERSYAFSIRSSHGKRT